MKDGRLIRTESERRTLIAALETYGHGCLKAIQAMTLAGDEDKRVEFAARFDEAKSIAERVLGLA